MRLKLAAIHCVVASIALVCASSVSVSANDVGNALCSTPDQIDQYVLALSWQPAFCERLQHLPECIQNDNRIKSGWFALHGLWPNQDGCDKNYSYCGEVKTRPRRFCDYPELKLSDKVRQELASVMPSAGAGSCLQRHEWFKHGSCQTKWTMDQYYSVAIDFVRQFNESGVGYFMSRNLGKTIQEQDFLDRLDCALGKGTRERVRLRCKGGNLTDVYVGLPAAFSHGDELGKLIGQTVEGFESNCNGTFRIDEFD